jgi:hypothetical protein
LTTLTIVPAMIDSPAMTASQSSGDIQLSHLGESRSCRQGVSVSPLVNLKERLAGEVTAPS